MVTDPERADIVEPPAPEGGERGLVIFSYPKTIFLIPTLIAALVGFLGMLTIGDRAGDAAGVPIVAEVRGADRLASEEPPSSATDRPIGARHVLALVFLGAFALNLLVMTVDFPRFTVVAVLLLAVTLLFFLLWLNVYLDLVPPLVRLLEWYSAVANAQFYLLVAVILLVNYGIIYVARYLDYWVIRPNEILHNHGPFSDLERYPTFNLKFDKEIPDIFEYLLLRSGRIILHVTGGRKPIVLDNVLWISSKEERLKGLMSRFNVRITTDREVADEREVAEA